MSEYLIEDCINQALSEGPLSPRELLGEVQDMLDMEDPSFIKRQMRIMSFNGDIYLDHDLKYTLE